MKKDRFMIKYMLMLIAFFSIHLTMFSTAFGQGVVVTTPPINGTTTWGGITYNLQTTQAIIVDTIYVNTSGTVGSTVNLEVWYNPTAINGQPATFTGAPWVNIISSQAVAAGVDLAAITIPGGLSIPAGSNWGFYIGDPNFTNTGVRYGSSGSVSTVTDGIVTIEIGNNVGYGWVRNSATTNHPRYFAGGVNYNFAAACTGTPTAGNAVASTSVCANENFSLSLAGNTSATDLTYQWMSSSSATGPWTPIAGATSISETISQTVDTYYMCEVTCTNSGLIDQSTEVFVQTSPNLAAGTYTVGAGGDYTDFTAAVNALSCGIAGPVVFNALVGSGPFNEQIVIPEIINTSATNTVIFNGNGETLTSTTSAGARSLFLLDGADYVTIDNFNLSTQSATNNFVVQLTNNADYNTISNNTVDLTSALSSTSSTNAGIVISGSLTSATSTTGNSATNVTITGNTIIGGYYGITINGLSGASSANNIISDNMLQDFYYYGMYLRYNDNAEVVDNELSRSNRTSVSSFYGIYFLSGGEGNTVANNYIHSPFGGVTSTTSSACYAIYHNGQDSPVSNPGLVYNNIIHVGSNQNNVSHNGTIYALYNSSSDGVHYYHNTIVLDDANSTSGTTRGFYQTTTASNIEFKNNIIDITREGSGVKYCLYFNTAASSITSDNNVLYINPSASGSNSVGYYGGAQLALADWQTASSGDMNSVESDPVLTNAVLNNFEPSSPLSNNIGTSIPTVTSDFGGNARNATTPDPGVYEFAPPTCPQPSLLNAINVTSTSLDLEWVETGTATTWNIEWGPSGFSLGSGTPIPLTVTNPQAFTNLNPSTQYDFYVQSDCGGGDLSTWAGPFTIYTSCGVIVAPYYEGFNNGVQPQCWVNESSLTSTSTSNYWKFTGAPGYGATANGRNPGEFAWADGSSPYPDSMVLITPEVDISQLTTPYLSFEWFSNNTNTPGFNVPMIIWIYDGTTWNMLDTLQGDNDEWQFVNYDLSAYSNNIIQVAFVTNNSVVTTLQSQYNDILLDEVRIDDCVSLGGIDGSFDVCRLDGSVNLNDNIITKPNGGGEWSFPSSPSFLTQDSIFNVNFLPSGSYEVYYVERFVCFDTTFATINVFGPSSAGIDGSDTVCMNEPLDLFGALSGTYDSGGNWFDFTNSVLPNSQPKAQPIPGNYNYFYVADNGVCPADSSIVTVTVLDSCDFLAIGEELFTDISVFPNPATTQLNIVNPSNTSALKIEMLDMNGRVVLVENKALNNASQLTLTIDFLEKGIYTLRVYNEEGQKTFKIVKQ